MVLIKNVNEARARRRERRRRLMRKGLQVLPNLFTLGNGFFGFLSIIFSANEDFVGAAYFILLGALMDLLDGRMARMVGVTSEVGMQLDSLCDAVTFCLAPAFLMYSWNLHQIEFLGFLSCVFFLLAGILRLARFNVTSEVQSIFFLGVPTTVAGCFLATFFLNVQSYSLSNTVFLLGLATLVCVMAYLMVSPIQFPTFKHVAKSWYMLSGFVFFAFTTIMGLMTVVLLFFTGYFLFSFARFIQIHHSFFRKKEELNSE
ncbi:MAG: CDP-diacylglycerol--serine O-phosphatidyltransferase [bacterium]